MNENNKIRLFSYSKVWKIEHKIYSFQNITLPVPINPVDLLYFCSSAFFVFIVGKIIPPITVVPVVLRLLALPYGITKFLTKKKLDGKNPIKFFIGYIYFVFIEKNSYIEKFKRNPIKGEEKLTLKWVCSRGYSKTSLWNNITVALSSNGKRKDKKKIRASAKKSTSLEKKKEKSKQKSLKKLNNIHISTGPKLRKKIKSSKDDPIKTDTKSQILNKLSELWPNIKNKISDPRIRKGMKRAGSQGIIRVKKLLQIIQKIKLKKSKATAAVKIKDSKKSEKVKKVKVKKEKKTSSKKIKEINVPILDDITLTISVCSLASGAGCTHIAKSLAYFIKHNLKKSVCIVDVKGKYTSNKLNGIEVYQINSLYDLYDKYKYIILDVGKYDKPQKELKQAQIKIMCCLLDGAYIKSLALFARNTPDSKKWKYIFNHVPEERKSKVDDLMEKYEDHWCMPPNDGMTFSKEMTEVFNRLVRGYKL